MFYDQSTSHRMFQNRRWHLNTCRWSYVLGHSQSWQNTNTDSTSPRVLYTRWSLPWTWLSTLLPPTMRPNESLNLMNQDGEEPFSRVVVVCWPHFYCYKCCFGNTPLHNSQKQSPNFVVSLCRWNMTTKFTISEGMRSLYKNSTVHLSTLNQH